MMIKTINTIILFLATVTTLAQTTHTISAGSYYYIPNSLTIAVGDSVVWENDGGFHDVNGDINSITGLPFNNPETFDSPATNVPGAVIFAHKFIVAGTYNYDCSIGSHAVNGMVGSVTVEDNTSNISEMSILFSSLMYNQISNTLHIKLNTIANTTSLNLYNLEGKLIQTKKIITKSGLNEYLFPIKSSLDKGIYFFSIIQGSQKISKKIFIY